MWGHCNESGTHRKSGTSSPTEAFFKNSNMCTAILATVDVLAVCAGCKCMGVRAWIRGMNGIASGGEHHAVKGKTLKNRNWMIQQIQGCSLVSQRSDLQCRDCCHNTCWKRREQDAMHSQNISFLHCFCQPSPVVASNTETTNVAECRWEETCMSPCHGVVEH